jgi:CRP/FNR family cyclic AMP-dependent transcriptional regulator
VRLRKDAKVELIRAVPLFSRCSRREAEEIAHVADEIDLPEGTALTREGDTGREFMVIVEGEAEVRRRGRKLRMLGPGDCVGEIALLTKSPRTATVTATTPVRALVLTDRAFRRMIEDQPLIAAKVLETLAERLAPSAI